MPSGLSDVDLPEKLCAEHISNAVNLKWTLSGAEATGVATLKGISLSHTMLDLVTLAPLQWSEFSWTIIKTSLTISPRLDVSINDLAVAPQSEVTCVVGQSVPLAIEICNVSSSALEQLTLSIQFFQDYQNSMQNYRLETRVIMSGPNL